MPYICERLCFFPAGLSSADAGEEVCVCFANALVGINSLDLRAQVGVLRRGGGHTTGALG